MILWANLVVDIPPSLSLGLEPGENDIMLRKPRNPKKGVFSVSTAIILLIQGFSMSLIALTVFLLAYYVEDDYKYVDSDDPVTKRSKERHCKTLTFMVLCTVQLTHAFFCRSVKSSVFKTGILGNKLLIYANCLSMALLVAGVYIPGLNDLLELVHLNGKDWGKIFAAIFVHLAIVELLKLFLRHVIPKKGGLKKVASGTEIEMNMV